LKTKSVLGFLGIFETQHATMKKLFILLFSFLSFSSFSQIIINRSDYAAIGDKVLIAIDTPVNASVLPMVQLSGINRTWNFSSGLLPDKFDSINYQLPGPGDPVSANLGAIGTYSSHYEFVDSLAVKMVLDRPNKNINNLTLRVLKFPITCNASFTDSMVYYKMGTPADFNSPLLSTIGYDSVRAEITAYDTSICEGWGVLQLPDTSLNALKVKIVTNSYTNLYAHAQFTGWVNINSLAGIIPHQRVIEYQWFAKNAKGYMMRALLDTTCTKLQNIMYRVKKIDIPSLKSITPNSAIRTSQTIDIYIKGANTHFKQGATLSVNIKQGANKFFVNGFVAQSDTVLMVNIMVQPNSVLGAYDIVVNDPISGILSLPGAFTLNPPPSLQSINPKFASRNSIAVVTISGNGTHFKQDKSSMQVLFFYQGSSESKLAVSAINCPSDSVCTFNLNVDALAPEGVYTVSVFNNTDQTLEMVDSFTVSKAIGVKEISSNTNAIEIYPNPANNELSINNASSYSEISIEWIDLLGKIYRVDPMLPRQTSLDISEVAAGIYTLQLHNKQGEMVQQIRFVKTL